MASLRVTICRAALTVVAAALLLWLSGCSALKPVAEPEQSTYPPTARIELGGDLSEPRVKAATEVVEAYFRVPKEFDQSIADRLAVRAKYLNTPKSDFFYDYRTPDGEIPSEERLAALKTSEVEVFERGPVVSMKVWALYYGVEETKEGKKQDFFILWNGTIDVLLIDGEWKLDVIKTDEMAGGDEHPLVSDFEVMGAES